MHRGGQNEYSTVNGEEDDDESPSSSRSSFASQIHRPSAALLRSTVNGGAAGTDRVVSVGSCSDISNLCDIEDSEYAVDQVVRPVNKPPPQGQASIQTDV